jgi:alkaline phosphatase D
LLAIHLASQAQNELLNAGPMVGYSEMREVQLWVQTIEPCDVFFKYWNVSSPDNTFDSDIKTTTEENAFTAKFTLAPLDPGQQYEYQLFINSLPVELAYRTNFQTLPIWKWRGDPPAFRFVAGSCAYINEAEYDRPGTPYGGHYEVFQSIHDKDPDFMIWLGDNVYFREPDWNSRTGILHRYTHDRAIPELQPLLGSTHHYAIWDDHDYGPNNSDRGYWLKDITLEAFELFWANPSFGTDEMPGAITYFNWNDVDFFLIDNRYYRSPNDLERVNKTILGEKQKQWLKDNLISSHASFKFIVMGGQFLNDDARHETYTNYGFAEERKEIIDFIYKHDITGVIFLTGDRHYSELSRLNTKNEPVIYDLTVSPLTSGPFKGAEEEVNNSLRVPGMVYDDRNFGFLEISGPWDGRQVKIQVFDSNGKEAWTYTILQEEWKE